MCRCPTAAATGAARGCPLSGGTGWPFAAAITRAPCSASGGWLIQTHPAWNDGERAHWLAQLRIDGVAQVAFESAVAISAGFRVVSGNNILDATIEGLLADRTQLEGKLLHYLHQEQR